MSNKRSIRSPKWLSEYVGKFTSKDDLNSIKNIDKISHLVSDIKIEHKKKRGKPSIKKVNEILHNLTVESFDDSTNDNSSPDESNKKSSLLMIKNKDDLNSIKNIDKISYSVSDNKIVQKKKRGRPSIKNVNESLHNLTVESFDDSTNDNISPDDSNKNSSLLVINNSFTENVNIKRGRGRPKKSNDAGISNSKGEYSSQNQLNTCENIPSNTKISFNNTIEINNILVTNTNIESLNCMPSEDSCRNNSILLKINENLSDNVNLKKSRGRPKKSIPKEILHSEVEEISIQMPINKGDEKGAIKTSSGRLVKKVIRNDVSFLSDSSSSDSQIEEKLYKRKRPQKQDEEFKIKENKAIDAESSITDDDDNSNDLESLSDFNEKSDESILDDVMDRSIFNDNYKLSETEIEKIEDDIYFKDMSDLYLSILPNISNYYSLLDEKFYNSILPVHRTIKFKKQNKEYNLKLFEYSVMNESTDIFVGGPIWAQEWRPIQNANSSQFLLIYTHTNELTKHNYKGETIIIETSQTTVKEKSLIVEPHPCETKESVNSNTNINTEDKTNKNMSMDSRPYLIILQLWEIKFTSSHIAKPVLHSLFSIDNCGPIWQIKWAPHKFLLHEKEDILGFVALACNSGVVKILCVPNLEISDKYIYNMKEIFNLKPRGQQFPCLCVDFWSFYNLEIVGAGFANGLICLWNMATKSHLLNVKTNNDMLTKTIFPFLSYLGHLDSVTSFAFCQASSKLFASSGNDRNLNVWSRDQFDLPIYTLNYETRFKKLIWPCVFLNCALTFGTHRLDSSIIRLTHIGNIASNLLSSKVYSGFFNDFSFNKWHNYYLLCDFVGNVICVLRASELIHVSRLTKVLSTCTYDVKNELFSYKALNSIKMNTKIPKNKDFENLNNEPFTAVLKIEWNPNKNYSLWFASGGFNGLLGIQKVVK